MNALSLILALGLPGEARIDRRVPKTLLTEQGAPTAADKRVLQAGIEELTWVAALKPSTVGVPAVTDDEREVLEIAVLTVVLRPAARTSRILSLIHRAIPYPVLLAAEQQGAVTLSVAHKRRSRNEGGVVVADPPTVTAPVSETDAEFLASLRVSTLPSRDLLALYQGLIDRIDALAAARVTGRFDLTIDGVQRRVALDERARLEREVLRLRAKAERETQLHRRVDLNLQLQRLGSELERLAANL